MRDTACVPQRGSRVIRLGMHYDSRALCLDRRCNAARVRYVSARAAMRLALKLAYRYSRKLQRDSSLWHVPLLKMAPAT